MPLPAIALAVPAAVGLYLLLRKKPAPVATASRTFAPAASVSPAAATPAQTAADQAIVNDALAQFETEREFPLEEQAMERFVSPSAPSQRMPVDAVTGLPAQDFFVDPGSGLRAENAPPGVEEIETTDDVTTLANIASDPFGALGGLFSDDEEE